MRILLAALAALLFTPQDTRDKPTGLALKCGSEIAWLSTAEEASAEARKSGRLILWYVPTVAGTPMDRQNVVDNYANMGPWMMRDVVELVNRKFVPLRMSAKGDLAKQFGMVKLDFIEPGFVFLSPDLKLAHKVDRVSTWNEDWFCDLLRGVLAKVDAFNKPSSRVVVAKKGSDKDSLAEELMLDGDYEGALKAAESPYRKASILRRMRKAAEAAEALKGAGEGGEVLCETGVLAMKQGRFDEALAAFEKVKQGKRVAEAVFFKGAMLYLLGRDPEGDDAWKTLTDEKSPWSWKAAAELQHLGPFYRCFEELAWLPEAGKDLPSNSVVPRKVKDVDFAVKRSVAFLLRTQRKNGSWNDSNYDFGGKDSLPNVYMAGTAIAAMALLAWKDTDPKGVQAALDRAWPYLADEKNMATDDTDEVIWGYAYRLQYFSRLAAADKEKKDASLKKIAEIVDLVAKLQKKSGIWQHEYDAPFTTATVLLALWESKQAGAAVPDEVVRKGADALSQCRDGKGIISYDYRSRSRGSPIQQAAGRMPSCELALMLNGKANEASVRAAIEAAFEHHALIERIRKYDDHSDQWANGGFFFWYDMVGRAEAIRRLKDSAKMLEKQRELTMALTEMDGCFIDSHELGKSYGTAMALITLKLCDSATMKK